MGLIPPRYETPDPPGVRGTYGHRVIAWAKRELGVTLGPWQRHVVLKAMRYDRNGDLIAREVLVSTGRQNGKSIIVRVIIGWLLDEGRCLPPFQGWTHVLAAAHDAKQARLIYDGVYTDLSSIDRLRQASKGGRFGRTAKLTELFGIRIGDLNFDVVTSQPGSVRGKSAGLIAWDEMLTQRDYDMWKALRPAQSAQRSPSMLFTSTAGEPDSIVLRDLYDRLVKQATGVAEPEAHFYGAWWQSDDPDAGLDWTEIRKANPALGDGRLSRDFIKGEYAGPPAIWRQERLNHWIDTSLQSAVNPTAWAACRLSGSLVDFDGPLALGVDVHPGWERATIVAAGLVGDRVGCEVIADLRGTDDTPLTAARLVAGIHDFPQLGRVVAIAYDFSSGAAAALRRDAQETDLPYDELKPGAIVSACMDVSEMITAHRLAVDDPLIDAQIAGVARRSVGQDGAFRFGRAASPGPIDAVYAMTFAAHAAVYPRERLQIFI
jgi:hypothetical protein